MSIASDYDLCVEYVSRTIGASEDELRGRDRARRAVTGRRLVAMILRRRGHSLPAIGKVFGVNHTTIMRNIAHGGYTNYRGRHRPDWCAPEVEWAMERINFTAAAPTPYHPSVQKFVPTPPIRSGLADDFVAGALEVLNSAGREAKARVWDAISDAVLARRAA